MKAYRPDRLVRVLGALVTFLYYLTWVTTILAAVGIPAARLLPARYVGESWHLTAPVTVYAAASLLTGTQGEAVHATLSRARADLSVPMAYVPLGVVALEWVAQVLGAVLMLLFLYHLRRVFQRVKAGAPFDASNATHLRWMGFLLLALSVGSSIYEAGMSLALSRLVEGPGNVLGTGFRLGNTVIVALVLVALGEIFRRGAALEEEQSLVV